MKIIENESKASESIIDMKAVKVDSSLPPTVQLSVSKPGTTTPAHISVSSEKRAEEMEESDKKTSSPISI